MEEFEHRDRDDVFSKAVRAGKRTYFFDVKETRSGEQYLTITESKKRFNSQNGKFFFEKHKIFLYKEDFEKFHKGLSGILKFIETGEKPEEEIDYDFKEEYSDIEFESLNNTEE